jgi:hypothetical protein
MIITSCSPHNNAWSTCDYTLHVSKVSGLSESQVTVSIPTPTPTPLHTPMHTHTCTHPHVHPHTPTPRHTHTPTHKHAHGLLWYFQSPGTKQMSSPFDLWVQNNLWTSGDRTCQVNSFLPFAWTVQYTESFKMQFNHPAYVITLKEWHFHGLYKEMVKKTFFWLQNFCKVYKSCICHPHCTPLFGLTAFLIIPWHIPRK